MASHPPDTCCTIGVKHEGTAAGKLETWGKNDVYVATPEGGHSNEAVVIFPDVIGHDSINVQLIADQLAKNGYTTVIVDLFNGDPIPLNRPKDFDLVKWRNGANGKGEHLPPRIDGVCTAVLKHLRETVGIKGKIGAMGYCFGAKYVARFLGATGAEAGQKLDAGYMAHPSFVDSEELSAIRGPLSIAAAETDQIFTVEKRHESEGILSKLSLGPEKIPYNIFLYSGTVHGFAVRADLKDDRAKFAKEQAFLQAAQWFDKFLRGKDLN